MQSERPGTAQRQAGSTRLLSTEELFEGFNELYGSAESQGEAPASSAPSGPIEIGVDGSQGAEASHLEITESSDAFNVRAELHSFDLPGPAAATVDAGAQVQPMRAPRKTGRKANPVLRIIDLLADADRENITATLRGRMLEVKMPKGRMESLAAARSALLASVVNGRPRGA
jgi:hypothetical protein